MDIKYKSKKLEKGLTKSKEILKTYGELSKKISQRMTEILSSKNLDVLKSLPGPDCHELKGNRIGQFAISISGNYRIIFEPDHDPLPILEDGALDLCKITSIKIIEVIDYH